MEPLPTDAIGIFNCNTLLASSIVFDSEQNTDTSEYKNESDTKKEDIKKLSIQAIIDMSMNLMHKQMVKSYLNKAHIIIEPKVGSYGFFDFVKGEQIIEEGRRAAASKTIEIKRKLKIR